MLSPTLSVNIRTFITMFSINSNKHFVTFPFNLRIISLASAIFKNTITITPELKILLYIYHVYY